MRRTTRILTTLLALMLGIAAGPLLAATADELVLVAGATGKTGRLIVEQLRSQGYKVRAFVRDTERARKTLREVLGEDPGEHLEFAEGDVRDPESVSRAMDGVTLVITSIGATQKEGENSPEFVDYGGVKNLADAAVAADVGQFVLISSMGVTHEDHVLNRIMGNVLIWKLRGEDHLRASGLNYTIVRPGGLYNEPGGEQLIVFEQGDNVKQVTITRADVANICVAALRYPEARNRTFEVYSLKETPNENWAEMFAALNPD